MSFRGTSSGQSSNAYERTLKSSKSLSGSNSTDSEPSHKLVLVGDSGVGKSCLLEKLLDMSSTNNFISTIGVDVKNHAIKAEDGRLVRLQVKIMSCYQHRVPSHKQPIFINKSFTYTSQPYIYRYGTPGDSKGIDQYYLPAIATQLEWS